MRSLSHCGKSFVILTSASTTEYVVLVLKSERMVGLLEGSLESLTSSFILLTWPCSIDDRSTGWTELAILGCYRLCKGRALEIGS